MKNLAIRHAGGVHRRRAAPVEAASASAITVTSPGVVGADALGIQLDSSGTSLSNITVDIPGTSTHRHDRDLRRRQRRHRHRRDARRDRRDLPQRATSNDVFDHDPGRTPRSGSRPPSALQQHHARGLDPRRRAASFRAMSNADSGVVVQRSGRLELEHGAVSLQRHDHRHRQQHGQRPGDRGLHVERFGERVAVTDTIVIGFVNDLRTYGAAGATITTSYDDWMDDREQRRRRTGADPGCERPQRHSRLRQRRGRQLRARGRLAADRRRQPDASPSLFAPTTDVFGNPRYVSGSRAVPRAPTASTSAPRSMTRRRPLTSASGALDGVRGRAARASPRRLVRRRAR